ncbi:MAG: rhomboid family intramembrane serine protease [Gemmatimonadota bacterium]
MAFIDRGYSGGYGQGMGLGWRGMLTPVVKKLLIANTAVFVVTLVVGPRIIFDWFAFQPTRIFIRPWGVFTYMFVHGGFWHLAMNMLVLFFFGPPLEKHWGSREFFRYYVIAGLGGVALSYIFLPAAVVGSSAAIYGLMLAFAMTWPDAPIYVWGIFPVKAKWLMAFLFVLTLSSAVSEPAVGGVAHLAHLGGIGAGFLYLKSGWRWGLKKNRSRRTSSSRPRLLAIVPGKEREGRTTASPPPLDRREKELYDAVDRVLDKISAHGMSSLTPEELKLLDEMSRRHRSN